MMREYRRKLVQRSHPALQRKADGTLRSDESDIGDVWAQQRRIKLAEAIKEDQRKAAAKQEGLGRWFKKRGNSPAAKEVTVTINLPSLKKPKMPEALAHAVGGIPKRRLLIGGTILGLFVLLTFVAPFVYDGKKNEAPKKKVTSTGVQGAESQQPQYETVLPEGETIEDLGGWKRASPPDKDPVFAYADTLTGVPILVSQQPLPESFRKNTAEAISKLAGQFGANEKLTVGDQTVYVGTSIKGPQSVIVTKRNLLILLRSEAKIENKHWTEYIEALR